MIDNFFEFPTMRASNQTSNHHPYLLTQPCSTPLGFSLMDENFFPLIPVEGAHCFGFGSAKIRFALFDVVSSSYSDRPIGLLAH